MTVAPPKSLGELFTGFLWIGARSFGGVLPWAYRTMVEERRWMTHADFTETIGLCQFLPGPNIGNASIVLGKRWFGLAGSIVAFLGLMALPFVWVLALFILYSDFFSSNVAVSSVVTGVGAAGAGLLIGTAAKLGRVLAKKPAALVLILGCFLCVGVVRFSLLAVIPAGLLLALLAAKNKLL
jgi:chromate transporter